MVKKALRSFASITKKRVKIMKPTIGNIMTKTEINYSKKSLSEIAAIIAKDWQAQGGIYFGARPYLDAMFSLNTIEDKFYQDDGRSIVAYLLCNSQNWKGQVAREIKKYLKNLIK
jgi:hypothetical protein